MFSSTKPILGSGFTHLVRIWCLAMSWSSLPAQWMQTVFSFSIQPRECIWIWAGSCSSSPTQQKQAVDVVSRIQGLAESPPPPYSNETPVNGESNFPPSLRSVGPGGDWTSKTTSSRRQGSVRQDHLWHHSWPYITPHLCGRGAVGKLSLHPCLAMMRQNAQWP